MRQACLQSPVPLVNGVATAAEEAPTAIGGKAPAEARISGRFGKVWIFLASIALAGFTVFVLLDTFAFERVQQAEQAADFSSIVAAQDGQSSSKGGTGGSGGSDGSGGSGGDAQGGAVATDSDSKSDSESGRDSSISGDGADTSESHGKDGHRHKPGSGSGKGPGGKSCGSGSSGGSGSGSSSNADVSHVVAGAASATSAGTEIGSYSDDNMQITVSSVRAYDTDIYVADIQVSSAEYLKTALAQGSFGRNIKDTTSNIAEDNDAVLAINGDYYGFRDDGYVLRNGVLYRDAASQGTDALVVYGDGSMASVNQDSTSAQELKDAGAWQVLSFGPTLVSDGEVAVAAGEEVSQSMNSNPRTAIGMVSPLHYVVVVSDGRTGDNAGLSLYELAQVLVDNGATYAYNLDGGGSTTLYFKGEVLNNPTSGNVGGERSVSDIVYFG